MNKVEIYPDLLTSLRLSDSSFPGGNFGFSNGLEAILNSGDVTEESLAITISDLIENRWKPSDCLALRKCYQNVHNLAEVSEVDIEFDKSSTSSVAREGSVSNGRALLSTAATLGASTAREYLKLTRDGNAIGHLPVAQSIYWHHSGLNEADAIHLSFYSTVSNYCQVSVRLGAVGALQAQRIMTRVLNEFSIPVSPAFWESTPSSFTPHSDISTLKLSQKDLRLFRN